MALRDKDGISGAGLIGGAIVVSALIVSWGLPDPPRYQIAGSGNAVIRLDTDSGEMIACNLQACRQIERPDRAKTFGPLSIQFGDGDRTVGVRRDTDVQRDRESGNESSSGRSRTTPPDPEGR